MAKKKLPWMQFYGSDWRADSAVRMCSRAARSFWIDLLTLMHDAEPYGHLLIQSVKPSLAQLASVAGDPEADVELWIAELEKNGVFSRTEDGTIYCRRMVRKAQKSKTNSENGKKGGNPRLKGSDKRPPKPSDKPKDKGPDKASDMPQRPEAIRTPLPLTGHNGVLLDDRKKIEDAQALSAPDGQIACASNVESKPISDNVVRPNWRDLRRSEMNPAELALARDEVNAPSGAAHG